MYYYPVLCLFPPTHTSFMKAIRMEKERPTGPNSITTLPPSVLSPFEQLPIFMYVSVSSLALGDFPMPRSSE